MLHSDNWSEIRSSIETSSWQPIKGGLYSSRSDRDDKLIIPPWEKCEIHGEIRKNNGRKQHVSRKQLCWIFYGFYHLYFFVLMIFTKRKTCEVGKSFDRSCHQRNVGGFVAIIQQALDPVEWSEFDDKENCLIRRIFPLPGSFSCAHTQTCM